MYCIRRVVAFIKGDICRQRMGCRTGRHTQIRGFVVLVLFAKLQLYRSGEIRLLSAEKIILGRTQGRYVIFQ